MAEDTGGADPSMEEILASIRKIISDENPVAEMPVEVAERPPLPAPAPAPADDILELTQMVQDDGSVVEFKEPETVAAPAPPPPPPVVAAPPPPPPPPAPPPKPVAAGDMLVSDPAAQSAASALSSLASTVAIERLASSAPAGATMLGNGGRTLEDMVIELMRPLLKDWLDQNLPAVVDRLVQKEIERIARRS